jgi:hypothetical protein
MKKRLASRETFGAPRCCFSPRLRHLERAVHRDGMVFGCSYGHKVCYFMLPSVGGNARRVPGAELKWSAAGVGGAGKTKRPRGREAGVPRGRRALLAHERAAVKAAIAMPGGDYEKRTAHRSATVGELRRWVAAPALDAALDVLVFSGGAAAAAAAAAEHGCVHLGSLMYQKLTEEQGEYRFRNVARWTRGRRVLDVFQARVLLVPINFGNVHWALVAVDFTARRIDYIDSMLPQKSKHEGATVVFGNIQRFLRDKWAHSKRDPAAFGADFEERVRVDAAQQENSVDCGAFVLAFAEAIVRGEPLRTVKQSDIGYLRQRFAASVETAAPGTQFV